MSDIFISYAAADRASAAEIARTLTERGWSVWWDREIPFGESFDRVIERELASARSVIVLWSKASVESDWVRNEARRGLKRNVLVPAQIEPTDLPLEFSAVQTADLTGWTPDQPHADFAKLVRRLEALLGQSSQRPPGEGEAILRPVSTAPTGMAGPAVKIGPTSKAWVAAILFLLAIAGGGAYWWTVERSFVEVPMLVGKSADAAAALIAERELKLAPPALVEAEDSPPGTVLDQTPRAGARAKRGSTVEIAIAERPMRIVPALAGRTAELAERLLADADLRLGRVKTEESPGARPGTIVRQSPPANTRVAKGSLVDISVAEEAPPEEVAVPALARLDLPSAEDALQRAGLKRGRITVAGVRTDAEVTVRTVRAQTPAPGTQVAPGTAVELVLAEPGVLTPSLTKMPIERARTALEKAGLAVGELTEREVPGAPIGVVVEQGQSAGKWVARGTRVDLVVAAKALAETVTMPDLHGMHVKDAYGMLVKQGFPKPRTRIVRTDKAKAQAVIEQEPPPGKAVSGDAVVTLGYARPTKEAVEAGLLRNDDDAGLKCPAVCAKTKGKWTGQWRTTVPDKMSVCQCAF